AWRVRAELVDELRAKMVEVGSGYVPTADDVREVLSTRSDSPFLISVFDGESRILGANVTFLAETGYRESDLRAQPSTSFVRAGERDGQIAAQARLVSGEVDFHDTHGHRTLADGSEIFVAAHRAAVRAPDATLGGLVSVARVVLPFRDPVDDRESPDRATTPSRHHREQVSVG
ncbi:MAG: PAS domain S-box protein, partial [Acidimicrobiia bacterium]